jgi:hypothetical protein
MLLLMASAEVLLGFTVGFLARVRWRRAWTIHGPHARGLSALEGRERPASGVLTSPSGVARGGGEGQPL